MRIRQLDRHELANIWSIDRAEVIDNVFRRRGNRLVLEPEHHDVRSWPLGEPEHYGPLLLDCFDRGGSCFGAFDAGILVGAAVLENRFIGREGDLLQLKFLHVGRSHRGLGLGTALFESAVTRADELGARGLYVSATPSENTVRFYQRRGFRLTVDPDTELFELEPEDIHMEFDIPDGVSRSDP